METQNLAVEEIKIADSALESGEYFLSNVFNLGKVADPAEFTRHRYIFSIKGKF